jgi:hypothetical protein
VMGSVWRSSRSGFSFGGGGEVSSSFATGRVSTVSGEKARQERARAWGHQQRGKGQCWLEKLVL